MIKTFEEIIMNIKGHQIWKPLASDSRVKEIESIEFDGFDGILINLDDKYNSVFIPGDMKFKLQQEEVSFEKAIQELKKGKTIESVYDNQIYKIKDNNIYSLMDNGEWLTYTYPFNEMQILNDWYVND